MFKIGVCGFGTVGKNLVSHFLKYQDLISNNCNEKITISVIADRSIQKKKFEDDNIQFSSDILSIVQSDCDLIIELVGGVDVAKELVTKAIENNKSVITANKALIAEHGDELFQLSNKHNVYFGFEAAVAGAVPIINSLSHNMLNETISSISGIINGTCNYILDQMSSSNKNFSEALSMAQELGYAEADPTFDIGGFDAAHKISILAMLAYKIKSPYKNMYIEGIENIDSMDIDYSKELGYTIKHVAITKVTDEDIECRAHPVLIHNSNILSNVDGVMNAVRTIGDRFGTSLLYGHGAGGEATASAVVSNIKDFCIFKKYISNENKNDEYLFSRKNIIDINKISTQYYLRIFANDVPGVMAEVTSTLASHDISIEAVTQHEPLESEKLIPIVMITNSVSYEKILSSINKIESLNNINGKVNLIRVL
ncbi:MAG: homoserine dehydrogenase [Gammaproteobacteria bacterium]|nr:homoserine dehydrogenase [Gammaproteobacteria bacterium]MBL6819094.1 homoserine dehydrogenase [Gammaproteobacteria bacterium]